MSDQFNNLYERFQQMPRAIRWASYAGIGIMAFLVWDMSIRSLYLEWSFAADQIESNVREVRQAKYDARLRNLRPVVESTGPVQLPGPPAQTQDELTRFISELLSSYRSVGNDSFQLRERGPLPRNAVRELTGGNQRISRLVGELRFDADPQEAFSIIAELESHPTIVMVNLANLQRQPNQNLSVRLELEAWVKTRRSATGRGGRR